MPAERCAWPRCRSREIELTYLGRPLCHKHWDRLCGMLDDWRRAEVQQLLKLPDRAARGSNNSAVGEAGAP